MPRSPESIARRLEYTRRWRASEAGKAYHASWRADHAEAEKARRKAWKEANREKVNAVKRAWYRLRRKNEPAAPIPDTHTGDHELFEWVREVIPSSSWTTRDQVSVFEIMNEDLRSEAILAVLEGRDPDEAIKAYRRAENEWKYKTAPYRLDGWDGEENQ